MDERIGNLFGFDRQSFNGLLCDLNETSVHTSVVGNSLFVLYFDGDMGCALFSSGSEAFDDDGLRLELIDCSWCDLKLDEMLFIQQIFKSFYKEVGNVH